VAFFSLSLLTDSSNLYSRNSKLEATKCIGSSFVNESLFIEFHA
jgi:hypothetical protein